ncbi:MAG TPA: sugar transferase [Gaiellaceae bacterium]|nr:sugar transferase [Gaiellaceae bacterium]
MSSTVYPYAGDQPLAVGDLRPEALPVRTRSEALGPALHFVLVYAVALTFGSLFDAGLRELGWALATSAAWVGALGLVYRSRWLAPRSIGLVMSTAIGTLAGLMVLSTVGFWVPSVAPGAGGLLAMAIAVFVVSLVFETLARGYSRCRRVLLVGEDDRTASVAEELERQAASEFECVGRVRSPGSWSESSGNGAAGDAGDLRGVIALARPDIVVLAHRDEDPEPVFDAVASNRGPVSVVDLAHFYEHAFGRVPVSCLSPRWFLSLLHLNQRAYPRVVKRVLDVIVALLGLLVTAPALPVIAVLVRRSGPGGVLFRQQRLGEGGRTFEIIKFRTMVDGAEADGEAVWARRDDPRVTDVGRFLRRTRLDEVPQLWNVLRGDMSIVGPRPERPEFVDILNSEIPYWTRRHFVKPGITGWAQVRRGYADDVDGTADKFAYDLYYLKHRSLVLDLAVILMTARTLVSGSGAH